MAKAEQEEIKAVSPCVHSGEDGSESGLCRDGDGLGSRTCCRSEHCRNGPTDRAHREMGSREYSKSHQNSHGMDCDGSCQMKSEPILNNDVEFFLATKLKEKLILNGINLSPPPQQGSSLHSDCTESVHIDTSENAQSSVSVPTSTIVHECDRTETDQDSENASRQVLNHQQIESTFEYELPENLTEPFSVAKLIPETDEDIDVIPGGIGEAPVRLIAYESERQIQSIMTLITKDLSEPYSIYTYRYFIHNWPNLCFLAMHEAVCVGAIVCKLDNHKKLARRGYIAMLAVDQEYRKRKIGSNLVRKAIRTMIRDDCDEVVLETEITNKPALRLYENLGFVRDKRLFRYYLNGVDALRLKLWLR